MKKIYNLLILTLLLCALASGQAQGEYSLVDYVDRMTNYPSITIKITDKFMSVRGGCNIHTGYFNSTNSSKVAIGPFSSTQMGCSQDFDTPLIKKLSTASSYVIQNDVLLFFDKDSKQIARFNKLATSGQTVDINAIIAELNGNTTSSSGNSTQLPSTQGSNSSSSQQQPTNNTSSAKPSQPIATNSSGNAANTASAASDIDSSQLFLTVKKITLEGQYKPTNINLDQNILIVFEDAESVSIQNGCNMHFGVYTAYENGTLKIGDFFSTSRTCTINFDNNYLDALKSSDNWVKQGKNIVLKNGSKIALSLSWQQVATPATATDSNQSTVSNSTSGNNSSSNASTIPTTSVTPVTPVTPVVPIVAVTDNTKNTSNSNNSSKPTTPVITPATPVTPVVPTKLAQQVHFTGQYTTDISVDSDLRIKFQNNTVSILNGCNSHSADYTAYDNETIVIGLFRSTRKACPFDKDSTYLTALSSSVNWRKIGNQILLKQLSGASTIVLSPYTPIPVSLTGKYSTSISTISNLVIEFTQSKVSILNGCNMHSADYKAFANGQFSVGVITSTKRQCIVNYDSAYLNALTNSMKYQNNTNKNQITLKTSNDDVAIILTLIIPSKSITFSGSYVSDLSISSSNQIKFDNTSVTVSGGCNTLNASYQAYENKTIIISDFTAITTFVCKNDNDKQITDALKNSVNYLQSSDNKITLIDSLNKTTTILSVAPIAKPVTFQGNYTTNIPNDSDLIIKFISNQISILNGCNSFSGSYEADSLGNILFKQMIGTLKACTQDNDNLYTKALSNSITYQANGSQIIFRDINKSVTIILTLLKADYVKLSGKYSTNLPDDNDLLVELVDNNVNLLNGCNSQSSTYQAFSNGTINFNTFISTLKYCTIDFDGKYTAALTNSVTFIQSSSNQITFKNASGITTIILTPYVPKPEPTDVKFTNTYKPNLEDDTDLLIKLDSSNKVTILNGCNVQSATYKATDDGYIYFGSFISTRMYCQNDKDSVYTSALTNSVRFILRGDTLTLRSSSGQQTLLLVPYVNTTTVTPPVVTPPVVTPVKVKKVVFVGNYSTNIRNDSNLIISLSSDQKVNILNGCNSYGSNYSAFSNGSIFFGNFVGTEMACRDDYDYLYLNALADSFSFIQNKNDITLRDDTNQTTVVLTLVSNSSTNTSGIKPTNNTSNYNSSSTKPVNTQNQTNSSSTSGSSANNNNNQSNSNPSRNASSTIGGGSVTIINQLNTTIPSKSENTTSQQNGQSSYGSTNFNTQIKTYYSLTPCLKIFEGYYIVNEQDVYLIDIKANLQQDYYFFLKDNTILAALHKYRDNVIDYQIVFKSIFGTFNAIVEYRPNNQRKILLKSLAIIDFTSLFTSYNGCDVKDLTNKNCITCSQGFNNFKGRCFVVDDKCSSYIADECFKCRSGKLVQGVCQSS